MSGPADHGVALDHDQQAALLALRVVFGAEQVTVTNVQPTSCSGPDPAPARPPVWQAVLLMEEAPCASTCS